MTLTYAVPNPNPADPRAAALSKAARSEAAPSEAALSEAALSEAGEDRLRRVGLFTFKMGSVIFVLIGLLHTFVHLTDMSAEVIRADLEAIGPVENVDATAWELWSGLSLLMGFYAIVHGLSNLAGLRGRVDNYPAAGVCAANVAMLISVTVIGYLYLGPTQLIGGPLGVIMFGLPLYASLRNR